MEALTKERMRELDRVKQRLQLGGGGWRETVSSCLAAGNRGVTLLTNTTR
jgi:hypothetical protein